MIVAVTGGHDVLPTAPELDAMLLGLDALNCTTLRHGQASGVDGAVSRAMFKRRHIIAVESWPARWRPRGVLDRSAGHRRSAAMLRGDPSDPSVEWPRSDYSPRPRADLLIAWPGGPGTAGCIKAAHRLGITVILIGTIVELVARSR